MRIEVMRGHTKSLDANDKWMQTRTHERDTITSRKRQVVMRKVKSTIRPFLQSNEQLRVIATGAMLESALLPRCFQAFPST